MDRLREMILRVSRSQAPVHIYGESGTGKELVARMIHRSGPRAEGPFVPVNCGAIPSELMESEFFGHKRGSFTGAVTDKIGLIPSAEGGTLFLDEVADLPLHMQVKLLRVIQEKSVRPIGEQREAPIDVRILSPRTRTSPIWWRRRSFARTCSIASMSSNCACRRCANAPKTLPISRMPSCAGCRAGSASNRRR
jgi:two-component system response regulator PilR (NtrC family)